MFRDHNFCFNKRENNSPLIPILKYYQLLTLSLWELVKPSLFCLPVHGFAWDSGLQRQAVSLEMILEMFEMPLDTPYCALPASCRDRPVRDVETENPPFRGSVGDPVALPCSLAIRIGLALLKFVQPLSDMARGEVLGKHNWEDI